MKPSGQFRREKRATPGFVTPTGRSNEKDRLWLLVHAWEASCLELYIRMPSRRQAINNSSARRFRPRKGMSPGLQAMSSEVANQIRPVPPDPVRLLGFLDLGSSSNEPF